MTQAIVSGYRLQIIISRNQNFVVACYAGRLWTRFHSTLQDHCHPLSMSIRHMIIRAENITDTKLQQVHEAAPDSSTQR